MLWFVDIDELLSFAAMPEVDKPHIAPPPIPVRSWVIAAVESRKAPLLGRVAPGHTAVMLSGERATGCV